MTVMKVLYRLQYGFAIRRISRLVMILGLFSVHFVVVVEYHSHSNLGLASLRYYDCYLFEEG